MSEPSNTAAPPSFALMDLVFLAQIEGALKERLAQDPEDLISLKRLAVLYRKLGHFEKAAAAYARILKAGAKTGDTEAEYWARVLSGDVATPPEIEDIRSGRFLRRMNLLSPERYQEILAFATSRKERFRPSAVRNPTNGLVEQDLRARRSMTATVNDGINWLVEELKPHVTEVVNEHFGGTASPRIAECRLTVYSDGSFFAMHRDRHNEARRRLLFAFIYYFQFPSANFSGGELVVYDSKLSDDSPALSYTKIRPEPNSIVFLHADEFHEVLPVKCGPSWQDGRFSVTGLIFDMIPENASG